MNIEILFPSEPSFWIVFIESNVAAALIGGIFAILGGIATYMATTRIQKITRKEKQKYTSALLADHLDKYAMDLQKIIGQNESGDFQQISKIPALSQLPENADLSLVEPKLLTRILALPINQSLAEGTISFFFREHDPESAFFYATQHCGYLAYESCAIAESLRKNSKLPNPTYGESYAKFKNYFKPHYEKHLKQYKDEA